jgi:hypothetical protein
VGEVGRWRETSKGYRESQWTFGTECEYLPFLPGFPLKQEMRSDMGIARLRWGVDLHTRRRCQGEAGEVKDSNMKLWIFEDFNRWGGPVLLTIASSKEEALNNLWEDIVSKYGSPEYRLKCMEKLRATTAKELRSTEFYIGE